MRNKFWFVLTKWNTKIHAWILTWILSLMVIESSRINRSELFITHFYIPMTFSCNKLLLEQLRKYKQPKKLQVEFSHSSYSYRLKNKADQIKIKGYMVLLYYKFTPKLAPSRVIQCWRKFKSLLFTGRSSNKNVLTSSRYFAIWKWMKNWVEVPK